MQSYRPDKDLIELLDNAPNSHFLVQANSETWFSNQLAWLLDPKGSHGFGIKFAQNFLALVGEKRSHNKVYRKRQSYLKKGKAGPGTGSSSFNLGNSAVFREFYLARSNPRKRDTGLYCDIVLLDLDSNDGLFLTVENKLFTTDHKGQLDTYFELIERKFHRAKVREYVFLTIQGDMPTHLDRIDRSLDWVALSWIDDVRLLLSETCQKAEKAPTRAVKDLLKLLTWMSQLQSYLKQIGESANPKQLLLQGATDCILEELTRLSEGKRGAWSTGRKLGSIKHSSRRSQLQINLLPGLSVAIHGMSKQRSEFEKILIPFGAQPDQVFNLIDIAVRDIYHLFFKDTEIYLNKKRRLRSTRSEEKQHWESFFHFLYKYRTSLPLALGLTINGTEEP